MSWKSEGQGRVSQGLLIWRLIFWTRAADLLTLLSNLFLSVIGTFLGMPSPKPLLFSFTLHSNSLLSKICSKTCKKYIFGKIMIFLNNLEISVICAQQPSVPPGFPVSFPVREITPWGKTKTGKDPKRTGYLWRGWKWRHTEITIFRKSAWEGLAHKTGWWKLLICRL